jgi:hypothetical protein
MKIAAALVLTGLLLVGLSACGSGSSSDTKGSTSTVPKKQAGGKAIYLTVANENRAPITLTICGDRTCRPSNKLSPGETVAVAAGEVNGSLVFEDGYRVEFRAQNPLIGTPYIGLQSRNPDQSERVSNLSEGERRVVTLNGKPFTASREPDTDDYKQLTLKVGE